MNSARDKRIMIFTSLLRTLNFVGHSRVDQCYRMFLKFEEQHLLTNSYMKAGRAVDHANMKMFITKYKEKHNG